MRFNPKQKAYSNFKATAAVCYFIPAVISVFMIIKFYGHRRTIVSGVHTENGIWNHAMSEAFPLSLLA